MRSYIDHDFKLASRFYSFRKVPSKSEPLHVTFKHYVLNWGGLAFVSNENLKCDLPPLLGHRANAAHLNVVIHEKKGFILLNTLEKESVNFSVVVLVSEVHFRNVLL